MINMPPVNYKGFNLTTNTIDEMDRLKKTVDDYEQEILQNPMSVDAARIDMARRSACKMLTPMTTDQATFLGWIASGLKNAGTLVSAVSPNRIEARHYTKSSRVRCLVHGGMLGLLSVRLMHDSSQGQMKRRSDTHHSMSVIERVNNQAGCTHVKWSIPEFQRRFNMKFKCLRWDENPFIAMDIDDVFVQLNLLNTEENRDLFRAECTQYANNPTHSRIVASTPHVTQDPWISNFIAAFSKACSFNMAQVSNSSLMKLTRCANLVDLYHFMQSNIAWIFNDPLMRCITNMNRLCEKYQERLIFMANSGIEHAAYMMATHFPELMTPELHVRVDPAPDVYRSPSMQIADDDALFGPLKATYHMLMPATPAPPAPPQRRYYDDSEYDDYDDNVSG
jgi:hypothetical protein